MQPFDEEQLSFVVRLTSAKKDVLLACYRTIRTHVNPNTSRAALTRDLLKWATRPDSIPAGSGPDASNRLLAALAAHHLINPLWLRLEQPPREPPLTAEADSENLFG